MTSQESSTIDRNTKISIGVVLTLVVHGMVGVSGYYSIMSRLDALEVQLEAEKETRMLATDERYTESDAEAWAARFAIDNPGLTVRNPADLSDIIQRGRPQ